MMSNDERMLVKGIGFVLGRLSELLGFFQIVSNLVPQHCYFWFMFCSAPLPYFIYFFFL